MLNILKIWSLCLWHNWSWTKITQRSPSVKNGPYHLINYLSYHAKTVHGFVWMSDQYLVQISSNSEMVELEPFVQLTRNDPSLIIDNFSLFHSCLFHKSCPDSIPIRTDFIAFWLLPLVSYVVLLFLFSYLLSILFLAQCGKLSFHTSLIDFFDALKAITAMPNPGTKYYAVSIL